ncbi:MAG: AMP-binding protein [Intrasporangium sp.]|uniref:AMP-binding protein n=1 Tax=Intrasporangium sp. TaxID=1925024 RepID=UPI002647CFAA|nr:AMP-binding protein [Intrasporangium sp.]MDN5796923.1 AMP-binding protein [Intrasporangium sp.]
MSPTTSITKLAASTEAAATRPDPVTTAELILTRLGDHKVGILFEDETYTWDTYVRESIRRSHLLLDRIDPSRPPHVGILMGNRPEYLFVWGAAALAGLTLVSLNATRRGQELADDVVATDCQLVLVGADERDSLAALGGGGEVGDDGGDGGVQAKVPVLDVDSADYRDEVAAQDDHTPPEAPAAYDPATILMMQFTSGSTGRPKAALCSTGRFAFAAGYGLGGLTRDGVAYNAMPLFHSNALLACWASPLYLGSGFALARRFSASGFLDDLLKFRATYFNYVGRVLSYLLAQPERPEEKQTALRAVWGTEATTRDRSEFARRFGVEPFESYGSSEGGLNLVRTPDTPEDALGLPPTVVTYEAAVLDPFTLAEKPRARFGDNHTILNPEEAIGELVALGNASTFEGYYQDPAATAERTREGHFWTGDLGYRDEAGFFYFAGRGGDRFRVDGENFTAAPIERIIGRYGRTLLAAVYPVPDEVSGDQVMLALQLDGDAPFDPRDFGRFLEAQPDLGTKWIPRYVRIVSALPVTATNKINKPALRREYWDTSDEVWERSDRQFTYTRLGDERRNEIRATYVESGREPLLKR